jgi:hypothetical protein
MPNRSSIRARAAARCTAALALAGLGHASPAHASFLSGDALDSAADVLAWIVIVVVPIVGIALFWMVHVLPEKVAEKKGHPQAEAIKVLCLLSLVFGGMLWPFAWLWAYSKPVMYKLAYGADRVPPDAHGDAHAPAATGSAAPEATAPAEGAR